ncbi:hypothetical protein COCNU_08G002470 [Cocos nucifera]|uniref:Uncharacterized protein n=1 Tax=Cocos nucifera TaxID=13894 RepID=A0A8K0IH69_COCNU|nr:hypothetical protein COCNU_08G002470 [Cocos nucifera]
MVIWKPSQSCRPQQAGHRTQVIGFLRTMPLEMAKKARMGEGVDQGAEPMGKVTRDVDLLGSPGGGNNLFENL